jgi:hypothetical protein
MDKSIHYELKGFLHRIYLQPAKHKLLFDKRLLLPVSVVDLKLLELVEKAGNQATTGAFDTIKLFINW